VGLGDIKMVCKCFCDACGRETNDDRFIRIVLTRHDVEDGIGKSDVFIHKSLCKNCYRLMKILIKTYGLWGV